MWSSFWTNANQSLPVGQVLPKRSQMLALFSGCAEEILQGKRKAPVLRRTSKESEEDAITDAKLEKALRGVTEEPVYGADSYCRIINRSLGKIAHGCLPERPIESAQFCLSSSKPVRCSPLPSTENWSKPQKFVSTSRSRFFGPR